MHIIIIIITTIAMDILIGAIIGEHMVEEGIEAFLMLNC